MVTEDGDGLALAFPQGRSEESSEVGQNRTAKRAAGGRAGGGGVGWSSAGGAGAFARVEGKGSGGQGPEPSSAKLTLPQDVVTSEPRRLLCGTKLHLAEGRCRTPEETCPPGLWSDRSHSLHLFMCVL